MEHPVDFVCFLYSKNEKFQLIDICSFLCMLVRVSLTLSC